MAEQISIVGLSPRPPRTLVAFQITRQHRRFVEFADAVRRHRYWPATPSCTAGSASPTSTSRWTPTTC
jgi:hypothetical protein